MNDLAKLREKRNHAEHSQSAVEHVNLAVHPHRFESDCTDIRRKFGSPGIVLQARGPVHYIQSDARDRWQGCVLDARLQQRGRAGTVLGSLISRQQQEFGTAVLNHSGWLSSRPMRRRKSAVLLRICDQLLKQPPCLTRPAFMLKANRPSPKKSLH